MPDDLSSKAQVVVDLVNATRKLYRTYDKTGRRALKNVVGAAIYYLKKDGYPTSKKFKGAVNHHVFSRARAALELLTGQEDVTLDGFLKRFREVYAEVEYITHEKDSEIDKFKASDEDYMTYDERMALTADN